jgi:hypothetical protein
LKRPSQSEIQGYKKKKKEKKTNLGKIGKKV